MKLLSIAAIAVGTVAQIPTAVAFTTVTHSTIARPSSTTQLHSVEDVRQRIKKAGGGITTIAPGDLSVYDPNEGGKLQGTGDLEKRITAGASFPGFSPPPVVTSSGGSEVNTKPNNTVGGTPSLANLLNSVRPRKDAYGGQSQC